MPLWATAGYIAWECHRALIPGSKSSKTIEDVGKLWERSPLLCLERLTPGNLYRKGVNREFGICIMPLKRKKDPFARKEWVFSETLVIKCYLGTSET
jgi:hypothetical protein